MKKFALLLLLPLIWLAGCVDKNKVNFTVTLQPYIGSQALGFSTTYNDGAGKEFYFSKFKFYTAHYKLIRSDNSEVEIKDAVFFDWNDSNWKSFKAEVDAGTYKGLKFYVGLDPQQNATNPDNYKASEALGPKDDMFWEWLKHRFVVLEGRADTSGQNFTNSIGLAYHVGTDACYKEIVLNGSDIVVSEGGSKSIILKLDLLKVFTDGTTPVNMFTQPATQSEAGDVNIAVQFAEQMAKSFSYSE